MYAGREERKLVVIAPIERKLDHFRVVDDGAPTGGFSLERGTLRDNRDLLAYLPDLELQIEAPCLVDLKNQPGRHSLLKALAEALTL